MGQLALHNGKPLSSIKSFSPSSSSSSPPLQFYGIPHPNTTTKAPTRSPRKDPSLFLEGETSTNKEDLQLTKTINQVAMTVDILDVPALDVIPSERMPRRVEGWGSGYHPRGWPTIGLLPSPSCSTLCSLSS